LSNLWTENGTNLGGLRTLYDMGDIAFPYEDNVFSAAEIIPSFFPLSMPQQKNIRA
jgi:hypothetical protein